MSSELLGVMKEINNLRYCRTWHFYVRWRIWLRWRKRCKVWWLVLLKHRSCVWPSSVGTWM